MRGFALIRSVFSVLSVLCLRVRPPKPARVILPAGASFAAVTDSLKAHGVISQPGCRSSCWLECGAWTVPCMPACTSSPREPRR